MLMVPYWILEGLGRVKLNINNYVGSCQGAYPESLIKIGNPEDEKITRKPKKTKKSQKEPAAWIFRLILTSDEIYKKALKTLRRHEMNGLYFVVLVFMNHF